MLKVKLKEMSPSVRTFALVHFQVVIADLTKPAFLSLKPDQALDYFQERLTY